MTSPGIASISTQPFPWMPRSYSGKRALDIGGALLGICLAAPLMIATALAVTLTSPGPVFYRGLRAGLGGRPFRQLKFRTMVTNARGAAFTGRGDPRVTAVGRLLRFSKLDEVPQLFNVLAGQMSLVGPRPEEAAVVAGLYDREQLRVLSVPPGITGEVQLRYFPDLTSEVPDGVDPEQYYRSVLLPARLRQDLAYVDRMSFWLDCKILLQTVYTIFFKSWVILWQHRSAAASG